MPRLDYDVFGLMLLRRGPLVLGGIGRSLPRLVEYWAQVYNDIGSDTYKTDASS